jgi:hypothetical protein
MAKFVIANVMAINPKSDGASKRDKTSRLRSCAPTRAA